MTAIEGSQEVGSDNREARTCRRETGGEGERRRERKKKGGCKEGEGQTEKTEKAEEDRRDRCVEIVYFPSRP